MAITLDGEAGFGDGEARWRGGAIFGDKSGGCQIREGFFKRHSVGKIVIPEMESPTQSIS